MITCGQFCAIVGSSWSAAIFYSSLQLGPYCYLLFVIAHWSAEHHPFVIVRLDFLFFIVICQAALLYSSLLSLFVIVRSVLSICYCYLQFFLCHIKQSILFSIYVIQLGKQHFLFNGQKWVRGSLPDNWKYETGRKFKISGRNFQQQNIRKNN